MHVVLRDDCDHIRECICYVLWKVSYETSYMNVNDT